MIKKEDLTKENLKNTEDKNCNLIQEQVEKALEVGVVKEVALDKKAIVEFSDDFFGQFRSVKINDEILFEAKSVAVGLGFTTVAKSGNVCVRWNRVNQYLSEFGFRPQVGESDFIPQSLLYLLAMKANNKKAKEFQLFVATKVLPNVLEPKATNEAITMEQVKELLQEERKLMFEEIINRRLLENTLTKEQRFQRCIDKIQLYTKKAGSSNYYFLCGFLMNFFGIDDSKRPYNMTRKDHIFSYVLIEDIEKAVEQLINGQMNISLNGDYYSNNIFNWKHEEEKLWNHYRVPNNSVFGAKDELYGCAYCGQTFEKQDLCIEHKLAKSMGGDNSLRNLAISCKCCNEEKGHDKTVEEMWELKGQSENHALKYHVLSFYN